MADVFQIRCGRDLSLNKTFYAYAKACVKDCITVYMASQNLLLTKNLKVTETIQDDSRYHIQFFAPLIILNRNPFLPGLCPQENIIFDYLNPREHLIFFAGIKGVHSSQIKHMVAHTLVLLCGIQNLGTNLLDFFLIIWILFRGVFRTQSNVYNGAFCKNHNAFLQKSSIIDVRLGSYLEPSVNSTRQWYKAYLLVIYELTWALRIRFFEIIPKGSYQVLLLRCVLKLNTIQQNCIIKGHQTNCDVFVSTLLTFACSESTMETFES